MAFRNKNDPPTPEQAYEQRLGEFCRDYEDRLQQIVADHNRRHGVIYQEHGARIAGLKKHPFDGEKFEQALDAPGDAVATRCRTTSRDTMRAFAHYDQHLSSRLSREDRSAFDALAGAYMEYGVDSQQVSDMLKTAPLSLSRAMGYALVLPAWHEIQATIIRSEYALGAGMLEQKLKTIKDAIPLAGYDAIRAALDESVWTELTQVVRAMGVTSPYATDVRKLASTKDVNTAMAIGLERVAWWTALHYSDPQHPNPRLAANVLDFGVLSSVARGYMDRHIAEGVRAGYTVPKICAPAQATNPTEEQVAAAGLRRESEEPVPQDVLHSNNVLVEQLIAIRDRMKDGELPQVSTITELIRATAKTSEGGKTIRKVLTMIHAAAEGGEITDSDMRAFYMRWHPDIPGNAVAGENPDEVRAWLTMLRNLAGSGKTNSAVIVNELLKTLAK